MTSCSPPEFTVSILGPVIARDARGRPHELKGLAARALERLALAPGKPVQAWALCQWIWGDDPVYSSNHNALQAKMKEIRAVLGQEAVPFATDRRYRLRLDPGQVDASWFLDTVRHVSAHPSPVGLDSLLAVWRHEPETWTRGHWDPVRAGWTRLIRAVAALSGPERASLSELGEFVQRFLDYPEVRALISKPLQTPHPKARLLIVEDEIGLDLKRALSDYDIRLVTSLEEWVDFQREGDMRFDLAIVDRHLTPEANDDHGFHVLEYLRDYGFPKLLMTVDPPSGLYDDMEEKYGAKIFKKNETNSTIRGAVKKLLAHRAHREGATPP
jgi:hypothetical protein